MSNWYENPKVTPEPSDEWEVCDIAYNCLGTPIVTMPAGHLYSGRGDDTVSLSLAMTMIGFGGVQVEGQADPEEWSMTLCCISEDGFLYHILDTDSEEDLQPARYVRARFRRME